MSDYPLCLEDESQKSALPALARHRPHLATEDLSEDHFDWDSAALVIPGGLSPARQLAMQRQQERLSSPTAGRKAEPLL